MLQMDFCSQLHLMPFRRYVKDNDWRKAMGTSLKEAIVHSHFLGQLSFNSWPSVCVTVSITWSAQYCEEHQTDIYWHSFFSMSSYLCLLSVSVTLLYRG